MDDAFKKFHIERFDIDAVSNMHIGHDGRRVGVYKDNFQSFFFKGPAGLGSCIVKFGSLTNDDWTGANDHDFIDIVSFWHNQCPPIMVIKRSKRYPFPLGPGEASG